MEGKIKNQIENYTVQELHNLLSISTKAIKIMRRNKTAKNARFWEVVKARQTLINELDSRAKII